jgi:hypothetical protein
MKPTTLLLLILCSMTIVGCAQTQQEMRINKMVQDEAVSLASHLKYGMSEKDAVAFLNQNGLTNKSAIGDSFGWEDYFSLSNRCSLGLIIDPKPVRSDGAWANGVLRAVEIYHSNGHSVPIALVNAP